MTGTTLVLSLVSTNPAKVQVPASVVIPANQASVSFPVAAVDNQIVDGDMLVRIRVFLRATGVTNEIAELTGATLLVRDDDGPTLRLTLARDTVPQGLSVATTGTITRNTATNVALTVNLATSNPGLTTVPASVTIPAGASSATFNLATSNPGAPTGNQSVILTASRAGFTPGVSSVVVSDVNLPDLVVARVTVATNAVTDSFTTLGYRIENHGVAPAGPGFMTRFFLSTSPTGAGGSPLGSYFFSGTLGIGQFFEQTLQIRLPSAAGNYWIVVTTDADGQITEIREDNNSAISAVPINVGAAYTATVTTAVTTAVIPTNVLLTGRAVLRGTSQAAAFVPVNIHIYLRETHRVIQAITDANGNYSTPFIPLQNEAGAYQIGAAHPGDTDAAIQAGFNLIGLQISPLNQPVLVGEGNTTTGTVSVVNLGGVPLSGLSASIVGQPANLSVNLQLGSTALAANGTTPLTYRVSANNLSQLQGRVEVQVTSTQGAVARASLFVGLAPLRPLLVVTPASLYSAMPVGGQQRVQFSIVNAGGVTSGPVNIALPSLPWLSLAGVNPLPPLGPGKTNLVTLLLTPAANLPLGPYQGTLAVSSPESSVNVPFNFVAMSEALGALRVEALDEFTYYGTGAPKVTNALVVVTDPLTGIVVTNGYTGTNGAFHVPNLLEAYYTVEVTAPKHSNFKGTILVHGGLTNTLQAFISRQMVQYSWTVLPTTIEDRTRITLEATFETVVPVPVITVTPPLIDLADVVGDVSQVTLQITNHGLIAAQDFKLSVGTHPDWEITPLVTDFGNLPAMSSFTVPVTIRRVIAGHVAGTARHSVLPAAPAGGSGPCNFSMGALWSLLCGGATNDYATTIPVINAVKCFGGTGGTGGGGGGGGGGGSWPSIPPPPLPGVTFVTHPEFTSPVLCECNPSNYKPSCFEIPGGSTVLSAAAGALSSALSALPNFKANAKANAGAKVCTCCDAEGIGLKLDAAATLTISGKMSFPLAGAKLSGSTTAGGYDVDYELGAGCSFDPSFTAIGTITGKTDCHLKNPMACANMSVSADLKLGCLLGGTATFKQNGVVVGKQELKAEASVESGINGSLNYCTGKGFTGQVGVKPVTVKASIGLNLAGLDLGKAEFKQDLTPKFTYPATTPKFAAIAQQADADFYAAIDQLRARVPGGSRTIAARAASQLGRPVPRAADADAGVCARVKIRIDQDFVQTRSAFNATLELANLTASTTLSNVQVIVSITDTNGRPANELFGIRDPVIAGLGAVDGTGTLAPNTTGSSSWIIIPTHDAAPEVPTVYGVGGVLMYDQDGQSIVIPLFSAPITVNPDPVLTVRYFMQRDVYSDDPFTPQIEPSVPFVLGVMVNNHGKGTARNVKIISGQPRVIENEKGLLIDFKIIGSQVNGQNQTPSLTVNFGTIAPDQLGVGLWYLTSTLQGQFVDYTATFQHLDDLGKTNLSLIDEVTIHELIHRVQTPGTFEDGLPDFLVNDFGDADNLPDTLYLSDGTTSPVQSVRESSTDGPAAADHLAVSLTAPLPSGWVYLDVPDPGAGQFVLQRGLCKGRPSICP